MSYLDEIPPDLRDVVLRLAFRLGELAIRELGRLLKRAPADTVAHIRRGLSLMEQGRYELGLSEFKRALKGKLDARGKATILMLRAQCLDFLSRWDEMERTATELATAAEASGDSSMANMGHLLQGVACAQQHRLDVAESKFVRLQRQSRGRMRALALVNLAGVALERRNLAEARVRAAEGYQAARRCDDAMLGATVLLTWSAVDRRELEPTAAYNKLQKAEHLFGLSGFLPGRCDTLFQLGLLAGEIGWLLSAQECFGRALEIAKHIDSPDRISQAERGLAKLHFMMGDIEASRKGYRRALRVARKIGEKRVEAGIVGELGIIAWEEGNPDLAKTYQLDAYRLYEEIVDQQGMQVAASNLVGLYVACGQFDEAEEKLDTALKLSRAIGDEKAEFFNLLHASDLRLAQGRSNEARASLDLAQVLLESMRAYAPAVEVMIHAMEQLERRLTQAEGPS